MIGKIAKSPNQRTEISKTVEKNRPIEEVKKEEFLIPNLEASDTDSRPKILEDGKGTKVNFHV